MGWRCQSSRVGRELRSYVYWQGQERTEIDKQGERKLGEQVIFLPKIEKTRLGAPSHVQNTTSDCSRCISSDDDYCCNEVTVFNKAGLAIAKQ